MRMQGFIFSWPGQARRAARLERALRRVMDVRVIHSGRRPAGRSSHWIHLGEDAYFSAQWNRARAAFSSDLLFHVQADASIDDFAPLVARARRVFARHDVGVYE